jgi:hypothetical protein
MELDQDKAIEREERLEDSRRISKWTSSDFISKVIVHDEPTVDSMHLTSKTSNNTTATTTNSLTSEMFKCRWSVSCIFQELPPLAKQYVMRLLHKPRGYVVKEKDLENWAIKTKVARRLHRSAIKRLKEMRILCWENVEKNKAPAVSTGKKRNRNGQAIADLTGSGSSVKWSTTDSNAVKKTIVEREVWLHSTFVEQMKSLIHQPNHAPWNADDVLHLEHPPCGGTPKELEVWATKRWERILHYVVGLDKVSLDSMDDTSPMVRSELGMSEIVIDLLEKCNLLDKMRQVDDDSRAIIAQYNSYGYYRKTEITQIGYEWMLKSTTSQIWLLLIIYLVNFSVSGGESEEDEEKDDSGVPGDDSGSSSDSGSDEGDSDNEDEDDNTIMLQQISILHLLFRIRCMKLGDSFMLDELDEVQQKAVEIFEGLGMVRKIKRSGSGSNSGDDGNRRMLRVALYPTHLGMTCMKGAISTSNHMTSKKRNNQSSGLFTSSLPSTSPSSLSSSSSTSSGSVALSSTSLSTVPLHVIVETNFHVYIYLYTVSPMYEELLKYFIDIEFYTKNMICGMMTRKSVKNAMEKGITALQILDFIEEHAHPSMVKRAKEKNENVVPPNVVVSDAKLYENFESPELFQKVLEYANKLDAVLAYHDGQNGLPMWMTIKSKHHKTIKNFIKKNKKRR